MFTLKNLIEEAELNWQQGKKEIALLHTLLAVAATSKKRYPSLKEGESFKKFISEVSIIIMTGKSPSSQKIVHFSLGDRGSGIYLEDILYKEYFCNMKHEAKLPTIVKLSDSIIVDGKYVATLKVGDKNNPHEIPDFYILHLIKAIKESPENLNLFT